MFTAILKERRSSYRYTQDMLLLCDIYDSDGNLFRDHTWVKWSKRFIKTNLGNTISFTATKHKYLSSEGYKIGLKSLRNIKVI